MEDRTSMRRDHRRCHRLEMLNSLKSRAATGGLRKTCESLGRLDPEMGWVGLGVDHRNVQASAVWCNLVEGFKLVKRAPPFANRRFNQRKLLRSALRGICYWP